MISVGIDLVEIKRISKSMKNPNFLKKILGENEYLELEKRNFSVQSVAASFCAKEAFSKAIETGIRNFGFKEVELLRKESGLPYFKFNGSALRIVEDNKLSFSVSVTHTKEYASVVVVAWRKIWKF